VLGEIPEEWSPFFDLLASTGLRVSEAIALRWMDLDLGAPCLWVRRSIVRGVVGAPKSRFRQALRAARRGPCRPWRRGPETGEEDLVFPSASGTPLNTDNLRYRVLVPAVERAGLSGIGFHAFRHSCASMLIERGLSPLRLQRWMGHHSAAYTLDTYGHLIDAELAAALDLKAELSRPVHPAFGGNGRAAIPQKGGRPAT
jgi:integrase